MIVLLIKFQFDFKNSLSKFEILVLSKFFDFCTKFSEYLSIIKSIIKTVSETSWHDTYLKFEKCTISFGIKIPVGRKNWKFHSRGTYDPQNALVMVSYCPFLLTGRISRLVYSSGDNIQSFGRLLSDI